MHLSSEVDLVTGYGLGDRGVGVPIPVKSRILHVLETGSGVHPTSYLMGTVGSFHKGNAAGSWRWPLTYN
jgi:hypothetical protein